MKITKSEFSISSATVSQCPKDTKPEYAFIGRSNVGKSSLINMLCNHKGLAKTSSTTSGIWLTSLAMVMPSAQRHSATNWSR